MTVNHEWLKEIGMFRDEKNCTSQHSPVHIDIKPFQLAMVVHML